MESQAGRDRSKCRYCHPGWRAFAWLLLAMMPMACVGRTPGEAGRQRPLGDGQIRREAYADRLRAMWLGETIANWTGLTTEAVKQDAPFYTDDDWGLDQGLEWKQDPVIDFVFQDPWLADDDTDIEYLYLHLMQEAGTPWLSPEQIATGWREHINDPIWQGSPTHSLIRLGAMPPATGMASIKSNTLMNEAQLITEMFGALAPGMPAQALMLADNPIRTNSSGYAAHAAQFYVLLYALATQVDPNESSRDQVVWLVERAREYIPDSSKTADIVDFVLADFQDNPDANDWERTRDRIYQRYHRLTGEDGFVYRGWLESSVNFATGVLALLYGQGDFKRTVQIGTLSGWDSDNGTATIGGLLGLMMGYDALASQFPDVILSDRYQIHHTRDTLPDYLPDDPAAEDTFTMMAERMLPLIEQVIVDAGGRVDGEVWTLPTPAERDPLDQNPLVNLTQRSANNQVRLLGGTVETEASDESRPARTQPIADGAEHDFSGREVTRPPGSYRVRVQADSLVLTVTYDRPMEAQIIRLVEGGSSGFSDMKAELRVDGQWQPVPTAARLSAEPDATVPYQVIDLELPHPIQASGVRVTGRVTGSFREVEVVELDLLSQ